MELIIGGSGSGKSAFAEQTAVSLSEKNHSRKYYLATMRVFDGETDKKARNHRKLRKGKGFLTIEQPTDIHKASEKMETGEKTALLECISNLAANEMFAKEAMADKDIVVRKIIDEISMLKKELLHFIVVSNNVFEDGRTYDKATMEYIHAMGEINQELADMADQVVEVVAGIPIVVKSI